MAAISSDRPKSVADATILLVDDNGPYRAMSEMALSSLGYHVQPCASPEAALENAAESPLFELLITDMVMANMNGLQLAAEMLLIRPDIKVLFCSGNSAAALARQGLDLGGAEFLMKPVSLAALSLKIKEMITPPLVHA